MFAGNRFLQSSARNVGTSYPDAYGSWNVMCISVVWIVMTVLWDSIAGKAAEVASECCNGNLETWLLVSAWNIQLRAMFKRSVCLSLFLFHTHTHACAHMHICTHTFTYMHSCHAHAHTHAHIHTHTYTYAHTHIHACTRSHTHIYTHIHIHTHAVWVLNMVFLKNWCWYLVTCVFPAWLLWKPILILHWMSPLQNWPIRCLSLANQLHRQWFTSFKKVPQVNKLSSFYASWIYIALFPGLHVFVWKRMLCFCLLHANLCSILNSGVQLLAKTFISFLNNPVINATLRECREDICTTATAILVCYAAVLSV